MYCRPAGRRNHKCATVTFLPDAQGTAGIHRRAVTCGLEVYDTYPRDGVDVTPTLGDEVRRNIWAASGNCDVQRRVVIRRALQQAGTAIKED